MNERLGGPKTVKPGSRVSVNRKDLRNAELSRYLGETSRGGHRYVMRVGNESGLDEEYLVDLKHPPEEARRVDLEVADLEILDPSTSTYLPPPSWISTGPPNRGYL